MNKRLQPAAAPSAEALVADAEAFTRAVAAAVQHVRLAAVPETTRSTYQRVMAYWRAWARLRLGAPLPLPTPVAVVQLFVLDHFGIARRHGPELTIEPAMPPEIDAALVGAGHKASLGRLRIATIDHRLAVLSSAHSESRLPSPCHDPAVRRLLSDCRRLARELGESRRPKTAATIDVLDAMLATCDDSLAGLRDRALLLVGWSSGGRRRSELAALEVRDLEWLDEQAALLRMRRSKTGDTRAKPVQGEAARALRAWLARAEIAEGPVFRRLWRGRVGGRLSGHAIAEIVKRRAKAAGLTGNFAGHSLRRGFATEAARNNVALAEAMSLTGHTDVDNAMLYHEAHVLESDAADLLERARRRARNRAS